MTHQRAISALENLIVTMTAFAPAIRKGLSEPQIKDLDKALTEAVHAHNAIKPEEDKKASGAYTAVGEQPQLIFRYKNHADKIHYRTVELPLLWFGTTPWYQTPQWLMRAYDFDRREMRDFAVKNILEWGK